MNTTSHITSGISADQLQCILGYHLAMYRNRLPLYQTEMLNNLLQIWTTPNARLLDVGGGTGVIAQAMAELFPVQSVQTVDLVDRFCPTLTISALKFDGQTLPFADNSFDAATLNNVLHHVPIKNRAQLLREIHRVTNGPLYIKDHESTGWLDNQRLKILDAIGNIPFGGMVWASYLKRADWENLAAKAGYSIGAYMFGSYRKSLMKGLFPNRLEVVMRLDPHKDH